MHSDMLRLFFYFRKNSFQILEKHTSEKTPILRTPYPETLLRPHLSTQETTRSTCWQFFKCLNALKCLNAWMLNSALRGYPRQAIGRRLAAIGIPTLVERHISELRSSHLRGRAKECAKTNTFKWDVRLCTQRRNNLRFELCVIYIWIFEYTGDDGKRNCLKERSCFHDLIWEGKNKKKNIGRIITGNFELVNSKLEYENYIEIHPTTDIRKHNYFEHKRTTELTIIWARGVRQLRKI